MGLGAFRKSPWSNSHDCFVQSIVSPVAPEWTTGEVLVGAAYRRLLLGRSEGDVDLREIEGLPDRLSSPETWRILIESDGALASPRPKGKWNDLPQLTPLVPEVAWYACVLGNVRSRWDPSNLLLNAIESGVGPGAAPTLVAALSDGLRVGDNDDAFARYVQDELVRIRPQTAAKPSNAGVAPAWRPIITDVATPAERFCLDLRCVLELKPKLTRRQWVAVLEALLRLGLGTHQLWLCRLANQVWRLAVEATKGHVASANAIENDAWLGHAGADPLLELGRNGTDSLKRRVRDYARGRLGLNLVLHSLDEATASWGGGTLGVVTPANGATSPVQAVGMFLSHVGTHATDLLRVNTIPLSEAAGRLADANSSAVAGTSGPPKNLLEFLRYSLGQLRTEEIEKGAYDQAYLLLKKDKAVENSPWLVHPGPITLMLMVHCCCRERAGMPASVDDFEQYLRGYGIVAPPGELSAGQIGTDLARLGLVVDSPDAGGGRLLVDPL